ncbi:GTPase-activating protein S13 [Cerrena zonata]|uniref:Protein transport protein SEC13 n=2 Tax=Dikarya TaxID=451864 RepID=A0A1E4RNA8_9ASCO|nr:protein transport protein SEC13 [Hyphopichia burtonii NRRL Y-1933]ODV68733.1 protein transport protein SEC13 [Hyphopichia burtonii NRRL Y-1933]
MVTIGNAHDDLIHDAVLDYYGKRLATASSDKTIKIFDIEGTQEYKLAETLVGHEGPVWQVAWAHPKFGSILATCSYDGKALIWKEQPETQQWSIIAEHKVHQASVNSVSWAPHELGAVLLCTSSDGKVSVVDFKEDGTTSHVIFDAHAIGVNSASWAPINTSGKDSQNERRFVTCGSDNLAKIWKFDSSSNTYVEEAKLEGHTDWVRDVCWSPSVLIRSYIATASQDRTVLIWSQDNTGKWQKQPLTSEKFPDVCWRASWSLSGNILAVSGGDNKISLWRENLQGKWESAGEVDQ